MPPRHKRLSFLADRLPLRRIYRQIHLSRRLLSHRLLPQRLLPLRPRRAPIRAREGHARRTEPDELRPITRGTGREERPPQTRYPECDSRPIDALHGVTLNIEHFSRNVVVGMGSRLERGNLGLMWAEGGERWKKRTRGDGHEGCPCLNTVREWAEDSG